jgi:putative transposase
MAELFQVSRSRYYTCISSKPSIHRLRDQELLKIIRDEHEKSRYIYGSPRIHKELQKKGIRCSRKRVARIMSENGIRSRQKRRFKVTTNSRHDFPVFQNLLNRNFIVKKPNRYWVSDITYIWTLEGWIYLCVILDLFSRMVVGYSMASHLRSELAVEALNMAVTNRRPSEGLIFHSDQGIQYASDIFREEANRFKIIQSMSRKGNCWDNACVESYFATLKTEEVFHNVYRTKADARRSIFEYNAVFYNRLRSHSFLDYLSPVEYENKLRNQKCA